MLAWTDTGMSEEEATWTLQDLQRRVYQTGGTG